MTKEQDAKLFELNTFAKRINPKVEILVKEESALMRFLNIFARIFNKDFLSNTIVAFATRIYVPRASLDCDLRNKIVHEVKGHVPQYRKCGLGSIWLGFLVFVFLYGLAFFPIFLAYFRYRFELGAHTEEWRWDLENGRSPSEVRKSAALSAQSVASNVYFWTLPGAWVFYGYEKRLNKVVAEWSSKDG